jgi:hypothetical protein
MVSYKIECQVNYIINEKSFLIENYWINDYKNKVLFEQFKKKIITKCIDNKCNKIQLTLNYEENIIMYLTDLGNHEYLVEVNKSINNKEEYVERLYIVPRYTSIDRYWFPLFIPIFFYPYY